MITTMPQDSFLKAVEAGLKKHETFVLTVTPGKGVSLKPIGLLARIWHWNDASYHEMRLSEVAILVAKTLAVQNRLSIAEAAEDSNLAIGRKLLKHIKQYNCSTPEVSELRKEILAAKLGIHSNVLDKNPGFAKFAETHHIERYLVHYGHELKVDPKTLEVFLMKDGVYQPWSKLHPEIKQWKPSTYYKNQHWVYGNNGLQNKNMYEWVELMPFKRGNPADWGFQYMFEFCSCYNPATPFTGNHSWIRLKTPEGDIYSVGFYSDKTPDKIRNRSMYLGVEKGHLMAPDVSEFWNFEIGTVEVAITKDDFLAMKRALEEDKRNDNLCFQLTNYNCVVYNKQIASIAGIELPPTEESGFKFLAPKHIVKKIEKLPRKLQNFYNYSASLIFNIGQVYLGARNINKNLKPHPNAVAAQHFHSLLDIFKPEKSEVHHPNTFAFSTRDKIMQWRQQQIDAVKNSDNTPRTQETLIQKIQFSLPNAGIIPAS